MIVPDHWAEGRIRERAGGRQITVRRWGWSDRSPIDAQAHADQRAREAFERIAAGEDLPRRERKLAYNGAEGVPIREQVVERHGDAVVTRNGYGARCLNTPGVLFADLDFALSGRGTGRVVAAVVLALVAGALAWLFLLSAGIAAAVAAGVLALALVLLRRRRRSVDEETLEAEAAALDRIDAFLEEHPEWRLRVYRTPAGLRTVALHRLFEPREPAVAECFDALAVDPVYARMCRHQNCFRARVSAKPWRIGIGEHMRPRPGVWPISPDQLETREAWIARYEGAAQGYAACRFVAERGSGTVDPVAQSVCDVHDALCRAGSTLPVA